MRILLETISVAAAATALLAATPALAQVTEAQPWSAQGRLEDGDTQAEDRRYDEHRVRLEAGRRYRLTANSDDFDPVLRLYAAGSTEPVAENDDAGDGLNSRIVFVPPSTGNYTMRIVGFSTDGRGAYTLRAELLGPLPPATAIQPAPRTMTWTTVTGEISNDDPTPGNGPSDDYSIFLGAGEEAIIRLDGAFDTVLSIYRSADRDGDPIATDDDGGGGLNSMLLFRSEEAGEYVIRVSGLGDGRGAYRLRIGQ
jgi:hypothetical protein